MASFKLSQLAKHDLQDIHQYGIRQWGEAQADRYFNTLYDHLETIANDPTRYPSAEDVRSGSRRSVFGVHTVYFDIEDGGIEILGIIRSQDTRRFRQ